MQRPTQCVEHTHGPPLGSRPTPLPLAPSYPSTPVCPMNGCDTDQPHLTCAATNNPDGWAASFSQPEDCHTLELKKAIANERQHSHEHVEWQVEVVEIGRKGLHRLLGCQVELQNLQAVLCRAPRVAVCLGRLELLQNARLALLACLCVPHGQNHSGAAQGEHAGGLLANARAGSWEVGMAVSDDTSAKRMTTTYPSTGTELTPQAELSRRAAVVIALSDDRDDYTFKHTCHDDDFARQVNALRHLRRRLLPEHVASVENFYVS